MGQTKPGKHLCLSGRLLTVSTDVNQAKWLWRLQLGRIVKMETRGLTENWRWVTILVWLLTTRVERRIMHLEGTCSERLSEYTGWWDVWTFNKHHLGTSFYQCLYNCINFVSYKHCNCREKTLCKTTAPWSNPQKQSPNAWDWCLSNHSIHKITLTGSIMICFY